MEEFWIPKLAEENSSIDGVVWFLVVTLIWSREENEQARRREIQHVQFEEKRGTRKSNGAESSAWGDKKFKQKLAADWNKGGGDLRARPHPATFPTCEQELKKRLSSKGNHQQQ